MTLFWTSNNAMPTTAAQATQPVPAATARTMLQIATPASSSLRVVAYGVEFANALTAACTVELIDTGSVAATVLQAHLAAGVQPYGADSQGGASIMTLGAGATGYSTGTATEGATTATRTGKVKILPIGATSYEWEWSQGREFFVPVSRFLRVRLTTANTVGVYIWVLWDE